MTKSIQKPTQASKFKIAALGSPAAIGLMQLEIIKHALDFKFYEWHVYLYSPILALFAIVFLTSTLITGGIYLTKKTDGD